MSNYINSTFLVDISMALAIFVLGLVLAKYICYLAFKSLKKYDPIVAKLLSNIVYIICFVLVVVLVLAQLGVSISPLTGVLTGIVFGVSISLKSSYSIIASGIMIAFSKPFKIGQKVDIGGSVGTVSSVDFMYTRLINDDGDMILFSNNMVLSKIIIVFGDNGDQVVSG